MAYKLVLFGEVPDAPAVAWLADALHPFWPLLNPQPDVTQGHGCCFLVVAATAQSTELKTKRLFDAFKRFSF